MRLRISPWAFLGRLLVVFFLAYLAWAPLAPYYARFLLRVTRVGVWVTEISFDPAWRHGTQLWIQPERSETAIFYYNRNFQPYGIPPQGIPAEWVMANLVLLVPLMLATPAPTWRARFGRLALAIAIALFLQVVDVVVGIKSFYAQTFRADYSPWATELYQFLDAFFQSWDTQLFPFAIWAGIHFRQLMSLRAPADQTAAAVPPERPTLSRAQRRRKKKR